jgi:glycosyltransferase involved in cell wall biosynthesis
VSAWDASDWIVDGEENYENTKRVAFLEFADLPRLTTQPLELALFLRHERDFADQRELEQRGWRIRHSREVAATPETYQAYLQQSRGEFSCAKRSCMKFQNAWVSDRTICYLASGKPVVVQDTGPSEFLPNGEGMFRFSTAQQAAAAFETINADYERHCRAARELAETYFDARQVAEKILSHTLHEIRAEVNA